MSASEQDAAQNARQSAERDAEQNSGQTLSKSQRRIALHYAGMIVPESTSSWMDVGDDIRNDWTARLLKELREKNNTTIASILSNDEEQTASIFKAKIKSKRRAKQGKLQILP